MKKYIAYAIPLIIFGGIFLLGTSFTQAQGLVPCGSPSADYMGECKVCHLQVLAGNVVNIFIVIAVIVATLLFLNAGLLYLTSSTNPANISKAHKIFFNTLVGLVIVLGSYLIVHMIMSTLFLGDLRSKVGDWRSILECAPGFVP